MPPPDDLVQLNVRLPRALVQKLFVETLASRQAKTRTVRALLEILERTLPRLGITEFDVSNDHVIGEALKRARLQIRQ